MFLRWLYMVVGGFRLFHVLVSTRFGRFHNCVHTPK